MSRFVKITAEVLAQNCELAAYLRRADIRPAQRGGTFVGSFAMAPNALRQYGIVLPKGGMILPDYEPDVLREILNEPERRREAEDVQTRRMAEEVYLGQVKERIAANGISDISVVVKEGTNSLYQTKWHNSLLVRGEEIVFTLHEEHEPYRGLCDDKSYKPWTVRFTPLENVELFLQEEVRLTEQRKKLGDRINQLVAASHKLGQQKINELSWKARAELRLYDTERSTKNVLSAHRIWYRDKLYELTEKNIVQLESEITNRAEQALARQEMLKKLFVEADGVFGRTDKEEACFAGHSMASGRARYDEWVESHYFVGQEEVTDEEYKWLNTLLAEVKVPEGYVRVANDTNNFLRVPEMPGREDVLVVVGKIDSRRGQSIYGEWFRGHPSQCKLDLSCHRLKRKIESITINGKEQDLLQSLECSDWKNPVTLARWALQKNGINPTNAYVEALAEVYRRQLEVTEQVEE